MESRTHITINSGSMGLKTKGQRSKVEPVQQNRANPYSKTREEYSWKKMKYQKFEVDKMKRCI